MKLLLYCTKAKPRLVYRQWTSTLNQIGIDNSFEGFLCGSEKSVGINELGECEQLNGKVVAECDFEVDTIVMQKGAEDRIYGNNGFMGYGVIKKNGSFNWYDENKACLSEKELFKYLEGFEKPYLIPTNYKCKIGYAIHIKNLHIFDKPYELGEALIYNFNTQYIVEKAPQNMMKVYNGAGECHILISIRPEWLCKILNGEKTIEVRKKVLKEMLE